MLYIYYVLKCSIHSVLQDCKHETGDSTHHDPWYLLYVIDIIYLFYSMCVFFGLASFLFLWFSFGFVAGAYLRQLRGQQSCEHLSLAIFFFSICFLYCLCQIPSALEDLRMICDILWRVNFGWMSIVLWGLYCCYLDIKRSCCTLTLHTHMSKPPDHVIKRRLSVCVTCLPDQQIRN